MIRREYNCWDYHDGASERRTGKALRAGYRDKVSLMTKIDGRTREAAATGKFELFKTSDRFDSTARHRGKGVEGRGSTLDS